MGLQFYYKNEDDQFDQNEGLFTSLHEYSKYKVLKQHTFDMIFIF